MTSRGDVLGSAVREPSSLPSLARAGLVLSYLATLTIPWTAVKLGGLRVGDAFLLLAAIALFAAAPDRRTGRFPSWVWLFVVSIVTVGVAQEFFPTAESFLANRQTVDGTRIVQGMLVAGSNLSVLIRFLIPIVGLPFIFVRAMHFDPRALARNAFAFTAGSAVSALIAFTDSQGFTNIGGALFGIPGIGRGSGLTEDPNYVALGCVFSLPFAIWQLINTSGRNRTWAALGLVALLLGIYGSGSRSGAGAGVLAVLLTFATVPRYRRALPAVALVLVLIGALLFVVEPGLGNSVLSGLRLTNGQGSGSDLARRVVNEQAVRDFLHSPIDGVGLQVAGEAHIVYLQALAAGGLILFTGYVAFLLAAMVRCLRLVNVSGLAAPLLVSIFAGAVFNAAQNALTLRIVFVPATLAAALPLAGALRARITGTGVSAASRTPEGPIAIDHPVAPPVPPVPPAAPPRALPDRTTRPR